MYRGRRKPEDTALYRVVQAHWRTFADLTAQQGRGLPAYVHQEVERYLACGIWAHGFVRSRCSRCGHDRIVALCCKGRGFCPSCLGRTMNATAALLVDHVIGPVPVRHWVLSLPPPLRYLCAHDTELCNEVVTAFLGAIFGLLRRQAKRELGLRTLAKAQPGAVTAIQQASSHLALNPHLHTIATEGVYVSEADDVEPIFRALPPPSRAEQAEVAWQTCTKTLAALRRRGLWLDASPDDDRFAHDEPALAHYQSSSVQGVLALGPRAGG